MSGSLRVVHVIGGLELGGAETLLYRLATHAIPGIEQEVICLGGRGWYSGPLEEHGIRVHYLEINSPPGLVAGLPRLRRLIGSLRPDVIQSWMYLANLAAGLAARGSQISVVWSIHNSSLENVGLPSRVAASVSGRAAGRLADFVINCSDNSRKIHERLGYSNVPNAVISNGYDVSSFYLDPVARAAMRRSWNLDDGTFVIGSVARWHAHKDVPNLLRAVSLAADNGFPLRCLLVGRELDDENGELTAAIEKAGVRTLVKAVGIRADVPALARAFDLHVLSSSSEAFPNAVAETMLSGTPNVVTDVGDAPVMVGGTGWVVQPRDADAMSRAILDAHREWANDRRAWEKRRGAARTRIAEHFSFDKMVQAYRDVWTRVSNR